MTTFYQSIENTYGIDVVTSFKKLAGLNLKLVKNNCRREFLCKCRRNELFPPHITDNFKSLYSSLTVNLPLLTLVKRTILSFKRKVLNIEIKQAHCNTKRIKNEMNHLYSELELLGNNLLNNFKEKQKQFARNAKKELTGKLDKKFDKIRTSSFILSDLKPGDWLVNLTETSVPPDVQHFLCLGPKMAVPFGNKNRIPIPKLIAEFEDIAEHCCATEEELDHMRYQLLNQVKNYIHKREPRTMYDQQLVNSAKATQIFLKNNTDIIVINSDKGGKTVIMYKNDYLRKMNDLVGDTTTYCIAKLDPTSSIQAKNNRLAFKLHDGKYIDLVQRKKLTTYKALPPKIYGLPKIHKDDIPLRPIVSCIGTATYQMSKFCADVLKKVTSNSQYNVRNSYEFVGKIKNLTIEESEELISFDVKSLFTNVPRDLAIETIKSEWDSSIAQHTPVPLDVFIELIHLIMDSGYFQFGGKIYRQIEGMPMGNCLSPSIADLVMEYVINTAITKLSTRPKIIIKYVDDLFLIVKKRDISQTMDIFNSIHRSIQFTCEKECNGCLPYLDVLVKRKEDGSICTQWYKKPIASGRLLNFSSTHPHSQKINTAKGLIHRVSSLTTDSDYNIEENIMAILKENGYPNQLITRLLSEYNERIINGTERRSDATQCTYISMTYIPGLSEKIKRTVMGFAPDIKIAFKTPNTAQSLYTRLKDKTDLMDRSNVIYSIPCECGRPYIGRTSQKLRARIRQHELSQEVALDENNKDPNKIKSSLMQHADDHQHKFDFTNTSILDSARFPHHLFHMEMVYIRRDKDRCVNHRNEGAKLSMIYSDLIWESSRQHRPQ